MTKTAKHNPITNPRRLPWRARVGAPVFHLSHHKTEQAAERVMRRVIRQAGMMMEADADVARVIFPERAE